MLEVCTLTLLECVSIRLFLGECGLGRLPSDSGNVSDSAYIFAFAPCVHLLPACNYDCV